MKDHSSRAHLPLNIPIHRLSDSTGPDAALMDARFRLPDRDMRSSQDKEEGNAKTKAIIARLYQDAERMAVDPTKKLAGQDVRSYTHSAEASALPAPYEKVLQRAGTLVGVQSRDINRVVHEFEKRWRNLTPNEAPYQSEQDTEWVDEGRG